MRTDEGRLELQILFVARQHLEADVGRRAYGPAFCERRVTGARGLAVRAQQLQPTLREGRLAVQLGKIQRSVLIDTNRKIRTTRRGGLVILGSVCVDAGSLLGAGPVVAQDALLSTTVTRMPARLLAQQAAP